MSNGSKPDFAKKLLNDLKMRKQRMAATQSSGSSSIMSSDTYGSSRQSLKSSSYMKSTAKANSSSSKLQRVSNRSQNQIVPYGEGPTSNQPLDLSMTLSYALDDNGKLKKMNLSGSSAMIGFLRQISKRSMDDGSSGIISSQIQWPSSSQFPTLTSLHVDEVSKGAQRLNHILKSFNNGCSVDDLGKELLKGAVDLEESLRMLVSLQEAVKVNPQRKSRVKLLEIGEEKEEGNDKHVERPIFSFDHGKKNLSSHRRSASSPVTSLSSQANSNPGRVGIPNVVAKLMGLEEIPRNGGESNKGLDQKVSQRMSFGDEGTRSNNQIVILTSKRIEPQKEIDEKKQAWSQREKEKIMSHIMQLNKRNENVGVKRDFPSNEVQRAENLVQGKRVSKENGHEKRSASKGVKDDRLHHPKLTQRIEAQGKNQRLESGNSKKVNNKTRGKKNEASEKLILKDIHEVKSLKASLPSLVHAKDANDEKGHREMILYETKDSNLMKMEANKMSEGAIQKVEHTKKTVKSGSNQKVKEVMVKPVKSAKRPSREMNQQETILQGMKHRKPVDKKSQQSNSRISRRVQSEAFRSKNVEANTDNNVEVQPFQSCEAVHSNQYVNLKLASEQQDQQSLPDAKTKPQMSELIQLSDTRELHQEKEVISKIEIRQPLTDDEIYLKQILITSQVFLNTAEALFKLNIPLGILNASDITCQGEEDTKLITECAYEMLKMKGKRRELVFYHCKNTVISNMRLETLDDLVRQIHKDFEKLRSYGKTRNSDNDQVEYLLKMLEKDMYHKDMDVNCMWDKGWNDAVFAYVEMDEVVRDVEKCMINELLDGVLEGFMEISVVNVHGESIRNGVMSC